jgi:endonuclease/exonuclease/phosphatase family metal-dependent hydrolase
MPASAQLLDGDGAEHPLHTDDSPDGGLVSITTGTTTAALWIGLEFDRPVASDEGSGLVLHLDADFDSSTGDEHGCELVFDLKARHGSLHPQRVLPGQGRLFERLGLLLTPSIVSQRSELMIPRELPDGGSIFVGEAFRFFVVFESDRAPDHGFVEAEWSRSDEAVEAIPLGRAPGAQLRLASWNIERDGLFAEERSDALRRLLQVIDPDVLIVIESFRHDGAEVQARVAEIIGSDVFQYAQKTDPGNVVLSRFPISAWWPILDLPTRYNGHRNSAAMIDTPHGEFMVLPQHWRCCNKEGERLFEADSTIGFLRDAFTDGGNFTLDHEVPFVVCGDLNLVTSRRPLDVVLTGEVVDKDSYGPDFAPGPDRTALEPVELQHVEAPLMHTWSKSGSKYYPARLDWVLVPSSVRVLRGFILDTGLMSVGLLEGHGLERLDSSVASDHAAVVVDLSW